MNPAHLRIEVIPREKTGGQSCGVTPNRVKVTHVLTGIEASCSVERSQYANKKVAMAMVEYGLAELGCKE